MTLERVVGALPVVLTCLPMIRTGRGLVRMLDFPRLQVAALAAAAGIPIWRRPSRTRIDRLLKLSLAYSLIYQLAKVYRYTPLHAPEVLSAPGEDESRRIGLLSANVLMDNRNSEAVLDVVERLAPDIMCFLEADTWWEQQLRPLERTYRYTCKCPLSNTYGMLLYSRLELREPVTRFLVEEGIPSMRARVRLRSGDEIMLHCLHPRPPLPGSPSYGRDAELVVVGNEIRRTAAPAIVIGDLNDVAWSYTTRLFQKVSGTLDPRVGRGFYNTFHAGYPLLRYSLDHVFHSEEFTLVDLQRLPHIGSDHFPIWVKLAYTPAANAIQEPPAAGAEDFEAAREILEDAAEYQRGEK